MAEKRHDSRCSLAEFEAVLFTNDRHSFMIAANVRRNRAIDGNEFLAEKGNAGTLVPIPGQAFSRSYIDPYTSGQRNLARASENVHV
jgi:hypothetical protein